MILDCASCPARPRSCDGCVVAVMLATPAITEPELVADVVALDRDERRAISALLSAGLVTVDEANSARTHRYSAPMRDHSVAG